MFDKFGEFDSAEEINRAAAGLKAEGDIESLKLLAEENGLDKEDAEDYMDGMLDELTTPFMAAFGKLQVEKTDLKPYEIMNDWIMYIQDRCQEQAEMAVAVRRKDKSLRGCMAELLVWSLKNAEPVDSAVLKLANVSKGCKLGIPGMGRAKQIITDYYMGSR